MAKKIKIEITEKQARQYNRMLLGLHKIKQYQTPKQLEKSAGKSFGLAYVEALEMAYENMQGEAKFYSKGAKAIKLEVKKPVADGTSSGVTG